MVRWAGGGVVRPSTRVMQRHSCTICNVQCAAQALLLGAPGCAAAQYRRRAASGSAAGRPSPGSAAAAGHAVPPPRRPALRAPPRSGPMAAPPHRRPPAPMARPGLRAVVPAQARPPCRSGGSLHPAACTDMARTSIHRRSARSPARAMCRPCNLFLRFMRGCGQEHSMHAGSGDVRATHTECISIPCMYISTAP